MANNAVLEEIVRKVSLNHVAVAQKLAPASVFSVMQSGNLEILLKRSKSEVHGIMIGRDAQIYF